VKKLAKPFNRYDDQSDNADPNVVFAWQSGHRPRQRGTTYGLDGAFPSQMQPALLNIYEWASVEWHQYLGHQSQGNASAPSHRTTKVFQQQPASTSESAERSNQTKVTAVLNEKSRRSFRRQPKLAKASHPVYFNSIPPGTQNFFPIPAARTESNIQQQPPKQIPVKYNPVTQHSVPGEKRKFEMASQDESRIDITREDASTEIQSRKIISDSSRSPSLKATDFHQLRASFLRGVERSRVERQKEEEWWRSRDSAHELRLKMLHMKKLHMKKYTSNIL
jgi:hypothetical protein